MMRATNFYDPYPALPGSEAQPQVPRRQCGLSVPAALFPRAGALPGMFIPNALSMEMLRATHAAHVTGGVPYSRKSWSNIKIEPLHPEILDLVVPPYSFQPHQEGVGKKKRDNHGGKRDGHRQETTGTLSSTTASGQIVLNNVVVSSTNALGGGTVVSSCDEKGQIHVRIKYDRNEIIRFAHSAYSIVPPACLRDIVMNYPEILSRFPQRHGVNLSPL